ncbi:MAG: hypothetical protein JW759_04210 [Candidatus Coatesbacteria bacterium]|nr:hypothetical protein [Candidatus Coatesbacteria bacterium]
MTIESQDSVHEERMRILKMVEDGKISADDAMGLLKSVGSGTVFSTSSTSSAGTVNVKDKKSLKGKKLRIQVFEGSQEKPKVNIKLPLSLAKLGGKFLSRAGKVKIEGLDLDIEALVANLDDLDEENIIEVDDEKGKTRVNLSIE